MTAHSFQPRGTDATRRVQCAVTGCYLTPDEHLEALASADETPLIKPRRCRCGRFPASYFEPWSSGPIFEADEQGRPSRDGDVQPGLPRGMVFATCSCGRTWKLRGVRQITDMERAP